MKSYKEFILEQQDLIELDTHATHAARHGKDAADERTNTAKRRINRIIDRGQTPIEKGRYHARANAIRGAIDPENSPTQQAGFRLDAKIFGIASRANRRRSREERILEQQELQELDFKKLKRGLGAAAVGAGIFAGVGAGTGVAAPHVRNATTSLHQAIGNPVGGVEVSQARANAADKIGLVGSNVPAGKRALHGAAVGGGGFAAFAGVQALAAALKKRSQRRK